MDASKFIESKPDSEIAGQAVPPRSPPPRVHFGPLRTFLTINKHQTDGQTLSRRNAQDLPGVNFVRIFQQWLVGLENLLVFCAVAVAIN